MRLAVSTLLSVALLALLMSAAVANIPDPGESTWDQCLGRSPKNSTADPLAQYTYSGVLRNAAGAPIEGIAANRVELEINAPCANTVTLNPDGASSATGVVVWGVNTLNQGGGACAGPGVVRILVDGLEFDTLDDVRSPDEDGNGTISLGDLAVWQVAFVDQTPLYLGDLNCDNNIALSDLAFWQKHFSAP